MKKLICTLLALSALLLSGVASADVVQVNHELEGYETEYRLYDRDTYEQPCDQPGQVVKLKYNTHVYDREYKRYVNVYLPYNYDENGTERYPILYFLHGNGCDQTTLIGNPYTVNAFDHMIKNGDMPPCIIVAPTYFYDVRKNLVDEEKFVQEMREEIMPLVESTYRTYAETTDEAGFIASRHQRAICGFSRGSYMTWSLLGSMHDYARTFLPFAGAFTKMESGEINLMDNYDKAVAAENGDLFVYMASGGPDDQAYEGCVALAKEFLQKDGVVFGNNFQEDNFFYLASDNPHQDLCSRYYLYNAFLDGLFRA